MRRRWIPEHRVRYAERASEIMLSDGSVYGTVSYDKRHQARWKAQALISLLVDLEMYERWELAEHTYKRHDGWRWAVEFKGGAVNARSA